MHTFSLISKIYTYDIKRKLQNGRPVVYQKRLQEKNPKDTSPHFLSISTSCVQSRP